MKKILALSLTLMLIPFSAFGLEMLEDSTLDSVTGQAGVSINVDIEVDAFIGTAAWGDSDGIAGDGGYVGLQNMDIDVLRVRAREDWALSGDATTIGQLEFLTIDVAHDTATTDPLYDGRTYVRINPGTFDITMDSFTADVALGADTTMGEFMGEVFMTDMLVRLDAGNYIDIYTHGGSGVSITMYVNMDTVSFATIGWGDTDGLGDDTIGYGVPSGTLPYYVNGDYTEPGYVGVNTLTMTELTVSGTVAIDVLTIDSTNIMLALTEVNPTFVDSDGDGVDDVDATNPPRIPLTDPTAAAAASANVGVVGLYNTWMGENPGGISSSFVHLALTDMNVALESMTGIVQVGSSDILGDGTLGDFYIGNVTATVNGWVDIFAH
jgi:hypothetical protein